MLEHSTVLFGFASVSQDVQMDTSQENIDEFFCKWPGALPPEQGYTIDQARALQAEQGLKRSERPPLSQKVTPEKKVMKVLHSEHGDGAGETGGTDVEPKSLDQQFMKEAMSAMSKVADLQKELTRTQEQLAQLSLEQRSPPPPPPPPPPIQEPSAVSAPPARGTVPPTPPPGLAEVSEQEEAPEEAEEAEGDGKVMVRLPGGIVTWWHPGLRLALS